MQTKIRKPIGILLTLAMLLSVFAGMTFTAGAASSGTCGDGLTWTLDEDGLLIISGTGSIDDQSFHYSNEIKTVVIESGVTRIGMYAFRQCNNLTSVTIPYSVTSIGRSAFENCFALETIYYGGSAADWDAISKEYNYWGFFDAIDNYDRSEDEMPAIYYHYIPANGKALQLNSGYAANITGAQQSSVWFGNYKQSGSKATGFNVDPVKWRVLSNADGKLFLLSDQNLDVVRYNESMVPVTWETCTLRKWLNNCDGHPYDDSFINAAFSGKEAAAIVETAVVNDNNPSYGTPGGSDTTDKVFLLSIAQATDTAYGFTDNYNDTDARVSRNTAYVASGGHTGVIMYEVGEADMWWLRSPGDFGICSSVVDDDGYLGDKGHDVNSRSVSVRPAFNLNLNSVLFTSAAAGGKAGDGALAKIADYGGSEWKLTLLDDARAFAVTETEVSAAAGGTAALTCTGAQVGTNEYISAILTDATGSAVYYGRLTQPDAADGTVTFTVPADLSVGSYTMKVFSEQYNGDYKTDYASAFSDVTLNIAPKPSPYAAGDVFTFGMYPQTEVTQATDAETYAALNALTPEWHSFGYYSGTCTEGFTYDVANGEMTEKDFWKYADVEYAGAAYRAVLSEKYRPWDVATVATETGEYSYQKENGYLTGTVYWFRYEPLRWRVLDPAAGLVLCDTVVDDQPFHNYALCSNGDFYGDAAKQYLSNDYGHSSLRAWLNGTFLNTAFSAADQAIIASTELTDVSVTDKLFPLSHSDVQNTAWFANDAARKASFTDYAKNQGVYVWGNTTTTDYWWQRTADNEVDGCFVYTVRSNFPSYFDCAVRPAMTVDLNAVAAAEFAAYRETRKTDAGKLGQEGDSAACNALIAQAQAAIGAMAYDVTVNMAGNKQAVDDVVAQLASDLAAQRAADQLAAAKEAAKTELGKYKDRADYRPAQQTELDAAITAGNDAIDAAADIDAVTDALAAAKAVIDAIKTDAELSAEEAAAAEETADEGPGVCEYCGETHDVNTITGFFADMLHDMLYIITRLARFFCYEIFVS